MPFIRKIVATAAVAPLAFLLCAIIVVGLYNLYEFRPNASKIEATKPVAQKQMTMTNSRFEKNQRTPLRARADASTGQPARIAGAESSPLIGIVEPRSSEHRRGEWRVTDA